MATINFATREITCKIVYYGPSGAGCNTNVERLWNLVEARRRSALHRFGPSTEDERSWYFDFVPEQDPPVEGFQLCWRVYSLPGGIGEEAHREEVMEGLDAVVFVADARPDRNQANLDHMLALEALLTRMGLELSAMPVALQVNQPDADGARPTEQVTFDLNPYDFPVVEAVVKESGGVLATHERVGALVLTKLRDTLAGEDALVLSAVHADGITDVEVIRRHVERIQAKVAGGDRVEEVDPSDEPVDDAPVVELPFQPRDFVGSHPVRIGDAQLVDDQVRLRLEMQHMGGGEARPLVVSLVNRPADRPRVATPTIPPVAVPASPSPTDSVFDYLPEEDELGVPGPVVGHAYLYGAIGLAGGVAIGLLLAYLLGVVA